jgi:hypothetical protein
MKLNDFSKMYLSLNFMYTIIKYLIIMRSIFFTCSHDKTSQLFPHSLKLSQDDLVVDYSKIIS